MKYAQDLFFLAQKHKQTGVKRNFYLLVNGKLIVKFEKNPSGGYLTKGNDKEGAMTRVVPGGKASLPSDVTHSILFCLECPFCVEVPALEIANSTRKIQRFLNALVACT